MLSLLATKCVQPAMTAKEGQACAITRVSLEISSNRDHTCTESPGFLCICVSVLDLIDRTKVHINLISRLCFEYNICLNEVTILRKLKSRMEFGACRT